MSSCSLLNLRLLSHHKHHQPRELFSAKAAAKKQKIESGESPEVVLGSEIYFGWRGETVERQVWHGSVLVLTRF